MKTGSERKSESILNTAAPWGGKIFVQSINYSVYNIKKKITTIYDTVYRSWKTLVIQDMYIYLIVLEGFVCPRDSRGYIVGGGVAPW